MHKIIMEDEADDAHHTSDILETKGTCSPPKRISRACYQLSRDASTTSIVISVRATTLWSCEAYVDSYMKPLVFCLSFIL